MNVKIIRILAVSGISTISGLIACHTPAFGQEPSYKTQERTWTYDPQSPDSECLPASGCASWRIFRSAHPSPYQATALIEGERETVIILSEPPPALTRAQYRQAIQALFGDRVLDLSYLRWPTGLDGYLEDIVLRVRMSGDRSKLSYISGDLTPRSGPAGVIDRLRMLYRLEYGTSDGFWLDTGETASDAARIAEVKAPLRDVYGWMAASGAWKPLSSESVTTLTTEQLNAATSPGAFVNESGIVVLVAPKKAKLADLRAPFRQFAVSSDLILGAVGNQNGSMLLLARARTLPLSELPPLRFETFAGFARSRAADIAQSYERQRIFAGKIRNGKHAGWDWAPILLSAQLDDTEFGTLLNQADQILKSWSQHGDVQYYAFPYPKPEAYPFGSLAASEYFGQKFQTTSLLFNWNTDGFSEIARVGKQDLLTASRSGALRILYRPTTGLSDEDKDESPAERKEESAAQDDARQRALSAQNYFAGRGNPILLRVVQNVLLYQAEQNFLTVADPQLQPADGRSDRVAAAIERQATAWLQAATQRTSTGARDETMLRLLKELLDKSGLTPAQFARLIASPQKINSELERLGQHAIDNERDAKALSLQATETSDAGLAAFRLACGEVNGTLVKTPGGLDCQWQHPAGSARPTAFVEADALQAQLNREEAGIRSATEKRDRFMADALSLQEKYVKALSMGRIVTALSGYADLDAVLADVVKAGVATSGPDFIRTPSVVLSKNEQDVEAVGGHNIDLLPSRVVAEFGPKTGITIPRAPALKQTGVAVEPVLRRTVTEPPAPVEQVLGKPRAGSLLAEMRNRTTVPSSGLAEVAARAKVCNCDAVVSQADDGTILFVRNAPPPVSQVVYGKSGLIDAMGAPPVLKEVHFENLDSQSVENLTRTKLLLDARAETANFDRTLGDLKAAFSGEGGRGNGAEILIARENKEPEFFKLIGDYDPRVSLHEGVSWSTAQVQEPAASVWQSTFGDEQPVSGSPARLIVRFGTAGRDALGISADGAGSAGLLPRLRMAVNEWLGRQTLPPKPISAALIDLRASILGRLKESQLTFYIKRNGGLIRGAHVDFRMEPATLALGE